MGTTLYSRIVSIKGDRIKNRRAAMRGLQQAKGSLATEEAEWERWLASREKRAFEQHWEGITKSYLKDVRCPSCNAAFSEAVNGVMVCRGCERKVCIG